MGRLRGEATWGGYVGRLRGEATWGGYVGRRHAWNNTSNQTMQPDMWLQLVTRYCDTTSINHKYVNPPIYSHPNPPVQPVKPVRSPFNGNLVFHKASYGAQPTHISESKTHTISAGTDTPTSCDYKQWKWVWLVVILAIKKCWFTTAGILGFYGVTHSYSSWPFLCALVYMQGKRS